MNTYWYEIYHISLEMIWWALFKASLIVQICPVIHEILKNKDFIVTDNLISQLFIITFVYPIYVQIALIRSFTVQLSLWKSVHWLWRYKLNKVCDKTSFISLSISLLLLFFFYLKFSLFPILQLLLLQLVYPPLSSAPLLVSYIILFDWCSQLGEFSSRLAVVIWPHW